MTLEQTVVISRDDLFQIVKKYLKDAGYDVCYMSETVEKESYKLKQVEIGLSTKDLKI
jgi:galactitol-specific phosphotransferase system IIB component